MFRARWLVTWLLVVSVAVGYSLSVPGVSLVGLHRPTAPEAGGPKVPILTLDPTSGPVGTGITATASGHWQCRTYDGDGTYTSENAPQDQVILFWDEVELTPRADHTEYGTYRTRFDVPAFATPGRHIVASRCADPEEDSRILATATFTVTGPPSEVPVLVPNLVGARPNEASAVLQQAGLVLGNVSGSGEVIGSQQPAAGRRVPRGTRVDITLVRTPPQGRLVVVPDLVDRTVNEARITLAAVSLILDSNADGGLRIRGQTPAAGTLVPPGSRVAVTVSELPVPPPSDESTAVGTVPPDAETPTTTESLPAAAQPTTTPTSDIPFERTSGFPWAIFVVVVLIMLGALGGTLSRQARKGPAWVRSHVRVVAGVTPHIGVKISESRVDPASRTCVVRVVPHRDSGTHVLEVEDR